VSLHEFKEIHKGTWCSQSKC